LLRSKVLLFTSIIDRVRYLSACATLTLCSETAYSIVQYERTLMAVVAT